jgi:anti-sigma factor RsiW
MTDPLELVNGYLDDDLSDDEFAELEAWILADSENAIIFARRAAMDSQIRMILAGANFGGNRA